VAVLVYLPTPGACLSLDETFSLMLFCFSAVQERMSRDVLITNGISLITIISIIYVIFLCFSNCLKANSAVIVRYVVLFSPLLVHLYFGKISFLLLKSLLVVGQFRYILPLTYFMKLDVLVLPTISWSLQAFLALE